MKFETTIVGRVGSDPDVREVNGKKVTNYNVACNVSKDKTVWVKVTTWEKRAEIDGKYIKKGMLVMCTGTLQSDGDGKPRIYTDGSGNVKASNFELTAYTVLFLSKTSADDAASGTADTTLTETIPF